MAKDLLDLLVNKYAESKEAKVEETPAEVQTFIQFCRAYLLENRPTSVSYAEEGITLKLQDATLVPVVEIPVEPSTAGGAYSFATSGKISRGGMGPRTDVPITGGK